jgi:hypothetical protein
MDLLEAWLQYLRANPRLVIGTLGALAMGYYLLNRRIRVIRENDRRFNELREERGEIYRNLRPPG